MVTSVSLFVADPSFYNHASPFREMLAAGGVGKLSKTGLSYFVDLYTDEDDRDPTSRVVDWTPVYAPSMLVDNSIYGTFVSDLTNAPQATRDGIYAIIDRILFHHSATTALETDLTTNAATSNVYVAGSALVSTSTVTDTVYSTTSNVVTAFSGPPYATFTITMPKGTDTVQYELTVYAQNASWLKNYPNSTITAVSPPIDYQDLLTMSLSTTTSNTFATAVSTAMLNYQSLAATMDADPSSGYVVFRVVVEDTLNNAEVSAPFLLTYNGSTPTQLTMREAVKAAVLGSGIGTEAQWQLRIPDLFIDTQFYLVPLYDQTTSESDGTIYPSVINPSILPTILGKVFPAYQPALLQSGVELILASYQRLWVASVEDPSSQTSTTIKTLFPTYQCYASTDSQFQYMDANTKAFAIQLTSAIAFAMGNTTSSTLQVVTDQGLSYVSFVLNNVEFCVVTPDSYTAMLEATS